MKQLDGQEERQASPYTPAALVDLMERRLAAIASRIEDNTSLIVVRGQLVEIPNPRRNGVIYDARLVDHTSPTESVLLELRASTLHQAAVGMGDAVVASGPIVGNLYNGRLTLRLRADRIRLVKPSEVRESRPTELPLLEVIRQAGGIRHPFPTSQTPGIALLRSGASQVQEDFLAALGDLRNKLSIREIEVSMTSPQDVVAAIKSVREDVLVLIRGGGADADFSIFETAQVIEALGKCPAYRILGLGHSRNRTLADCVADHATSVPAEAGHFLADQVRYVRRQKYFSELAAEQKRHPQSSTRSSFRAKALYITVILVLAYLLLKYLR